MLLEEDWFLPVVGEGEEVEAWIDAVDVVADLSGVLTVRVQIAAEPGPGTSVRRRRAIRHAVVSL